MVLYLAKIIFVVSLIVVIFPSLSLVFAQTSQDKLVVNVNEGTYKPLPIAIPDFRSVGSEAKGYAVNISKVISDDLQRSGLFSPIDKRAFLSIPNSVKERPNFVNWKPLNAQALVIGETKVLPNNGLGIEFVLYDVFAEQVMIRYQLSISSSKAWRRLAHTAADQIYKRITGESGYFDTRVVYISERGPTKKRKKRLSIMDQDGHNHKYLTDGNSLVLTPRFSPIRDEITYLAYFDEQQPPRVYLLNIENSDQVTLGTFPGMTFAPRFSPDGRKVIMSMAERGNTDIYVMDLLTLNQKQLTTHPAIDTSPSYSPDCSKIVFESDRGGSQQLYVMSSTGKNQRRISFKRGGRYGTPVWSPRGDLIAFTKFYKGSFHIGVMKSDGSGERLLTKGFIVEGPTWAPNGRVLMFYRQQRQNEKGEGSNPRLYSIDLTGHNEREIITPEDASDPAWSRLTSDIDPEKIKKICSD